MVMESVDRPSERQGVWERIAKLLLHPILVGVMMAVVSLGSVFLGNYMALYNLLPYAPTRQPLLRELPPSSSRR
jgi:hypothetical protein